MGSADIEFQGERQNLLLTRAESDPQQNINAGAAFAPSSFYSIHIPNSFQESMVSGQLQNPSEERQGLRPEWN